MKSLACIGDCGIDCYLPGDERRVGGITGNFAICAAALLPDEWRLQLVAPLGSDDDALAVRDRLAATNIDSRFVTLEGQTPRQWIRLDAHGERHFVRYEEGVLGNFRLSPRSEVSQLLCHADWVAAPVFEQNRAMFASLLSLPRQGRLAVDVADFRQHPDTNFVAGVLEQADIAFVGLERQDRQWIADLKTLAADSGQLVVVTLGAFGAVAFQGQREMFAAAQPVADVIDTTGAGDAFAAGFICCYIESADIERSMACGTDAAARAVRRFGGS